MSSDGPAESGGIFLYSSGNLMLTNCVVSGNTVTGHSEYGGLGGGIDNSGGQLTLTNSTVRKNTAGPAHGGGGGVFNTGRPP